MKANTKVRTNVSLDSDLLAQARVQNLVLSTLLETAIRQELKRTAEAAWKQQNRDAIAQWNDHAAENGVFSDGIRTF